MSDRKILNTREVQLLSLGEKLRYFAELKEQCRNMSIKPKTIGFMRRAFVNSLDKTRRYFYDVQGVENIPKDKKVLFVSNHVSPRDFLAIMKAFDEMNLSVSILTYKDGLSSTANRIMKACGVSLYDRTDEESVKQSMMEFTAGMLSGNNGLVIGETTMNIHPYALTMPFNNLAAYVAAIADVQIVPVVLEYIETDELEERECDIYRKCVVSFGLPINITTTVNLRTQTGNLEKVISLGRRRILEMHGIKREGLSDVDVKVYLNHTYLKKYGFMGFTYNSAYEKRRLYDETGVIVENEFKEARQGELIPGITSKSEGKKYVKRMQIEKDSKPLV